MVYCPLYKDMNINNIHFNSIKINRLCKFVCDDEYIVTTDLDELEYILHEMHTNQDSNTINTNITLDIHSDLNEYVGYCIQNIDIYNDR